LRKTVETVNQRYHFQTMSFFCVSIIFRQLLKYNKHFIF
jgi:hypothetical protein